MKKLQWLKRDLISLDMKMTYLIRQGDAYYVIWHQIQDLAAITNDGGKIYISPRVRLDVAALAKELRRPKQRVAKALAILEELELLCWDERGYLQLLTWADIQDYDKLETRRQQNRERVAAYRRRKAEAAAEACPPEGSELTNSAVMARYQQYWGQINKNVALGLAELVEHWGEDAVLTAIDISYEKGKSYINYIRAVLVNSNGQPKREESAHERWNKQVDQCLDEILSQGRETSQYRENPAHAGSPAAYGRYAGPRTENTLTQAMQV